MAAAVSAVFLRSGRRLEKAFRSSVLLTSLRSVSTFKHEGIEVSLTQDPRPKTRVEDLTFGAEYSDHMLSVNWTKIDGWDTPKIVPYGNLSLSPALSALHYSTECFEGMKAFKGVDGRVRLFRPMENMKRLSRSAVAASLPEFDKEGFLECIKDIVRVDSDWVPQPTKTIKHPSLYIRPTFIGTEPFLGVREPHSALLYCITSPVGPYFKTGTFQPVSLYADPAFIRAWPGGVGESKMGGNYGPTIRIQRIAEAKGYAQVLWLFGENHELTEVGTMNIFVHWINEDGDPEIATPPLCGTILPGVTRMSLLELAATWGSHKVVERTITMDDVRKAVKENRLKEMFGAGTACVVCPVNKIAFLDEHLTIPTMESGAEVAQRCLKELTDIQYGHVDHEWAVVID
jgi:branched-chain amino acid aminotransferase